MWRQNIKRYGRERTIGRTWVKKHHVGTIFSKACGVCKGSVYTLGSYQVSNEDSLRDLWICINCGKFMFAPPRIISIPKSKRGEPNGKTKQKTRKQIAHEHRVDHLDNEEFVKAKSTITKPQIPDKAKTIEINKVKGVGPKAIKSLNEVGIITVYDLLSQTVEEIMYRTGRKSDIQIKKWVVEAKKLI